MANIGCQLETWEEEASLEELPPSDCPEDHVCGGIFLVDNWYKRAQSTEGSTIP